MVELVLLSWLVTWVLLIRCSPCAPWAGRFRAFMSPTRMNGQ